MTPGRAPLLAAFATLLLLQGCKIVHNGDAAATDPSDPNNFNAQKYVARIWEAKAVPYVREHAHPLPEVLAALAKDKEAAGSQFGHQSNPGGSPWTFLVAGKGIVRSVNTASRHGEMVVRLPQTDPPVDVSLQIGPVVFGTAVRDALPFIAFGDFVNQIQYAEVSRSLNDRASTTAWQGLNPKPEAGQTVSFTGAMINPAEGGGVVTVTPVEITVDGASKP
jgi:predicted lipoprotein